MLAAGPAFAEFQKLAPTFLVLKPHTHAGEPRVFTPGLLQAIIPDSTQTPPEGTLHLQWEKLAWALEGRVGRCPLVLAR